MFPDRRKDVGEKEIGSQETNASNDADNKEDNVIEVGENGVDISPSQLNFRPWCYGQTYSVSMCYRLFVLGNDCTCTLEKGVCTKGRKNTQSRQIC